MLTHTHQSENQAVKTATPLEKFFKGGGSAVPFFQAKLTVNTPDDSHEREADAVADKVMRMPTPATISPCNPLDENKNKTQLKPIPFSQISRKCAHCEEEEKVQRKESTSGGGQTAPSIVNDVISSSGKPLDGGTRHFMESRMGHDFSHVQVHTDGKAAESATAVNALAYTSGNHIVFNNGQYAPDTEGGKRLLAHELVHVGQQKQAYNMSLQRTQSRRKTFPWDGEIIDTWSAALRSAPVKDINNPFTDIIADLPKKQAVKVLGESSGWLKVETKVGTVIKTGYVSRELVGLSYEATSRITETISNATSPAWNGTFAWDSKFRLIFSYDKKKLTVRIKLHSNATAAEKGTWKAAVEGKWSNQKKLEVIEDIAKPKKKDLYKIKIEIEWVDNAADAHHSITANQPGATANGRAGIGGTTSMLGWGVNDTTDVTHEFGHMLGNKEEYFTVDGTNYGASRQRGKGIMNNPSEYPFTGHFNLIKAKASLALNIPEAQCTIKN